MHKIGIDLGGTKIEGILLDDDFNTINRKRIPTPVDKNYNSILESIKSLINELKSEISNCSIGICTPGAISKKTGLIKNSNTQSLIGQPLKNDLEQLLSQEVNMENDANCFALAESSKLGSAKNYDMIFGIILGTGVGGGIIVNGNIHQGRTNIAGEWGHHILHQNGNQCYCGQNGCVETYLSGPALEKKWNELTGERKSLSEIVVDVNNKKFLEWKNEFLKNFGIGIANVIDILDPDAIVLGGGVSNIDFLYDEGKNSIYEKVFSDLVDTPILKNKLGDSAGVYGACMI